MADRIGDFRWGSTGGQDDQVGFGTLGIGRDPNASQDGGLGGDNPAYHTLSFGVWGLAGDRPGISNLVWLQQADALRPHPQGIPNALDAGVFGISLLGKSSAGVLGMNDPPGGIALLGLSEKGNGVVARSGDTAVLGESTHGDGLGGFAGPEGRNGVVASAWNKNHSGIWANHTGGGPGVAGTSDVTGGIGVHGRGQAIGLKGESSFGDGVHGHSNGRLKSGVAGINEGGGYGIFGSSLTGKAGYFQGNVDVIGELTVTGDIKLPPLRADFAEDFDIGEESEAEPGSVMSLSEDGGLLVVSSEAYDKRVAGVVSGAGDYRPGLVLDHWADNPDRAPIALLGKVFCKVDATFEPVGVGDLLTTSSIKGFAMKASVPSRAFGAVIGKALRALPAGQGLIPILVALQ